MKDELKSTLYDVLLSGANPNDVIVKTQMEGLDILPGDKNLVGANLELVDAPNRETRLRDAIAGLRGQYQFILIDCPPALDLLTLNAMLAADSIIIPIQCEFFALEGISQLMDTIERVNESFNHALKIEGILLTMYEERTNLGKQVADDLREFFQDEIFKTVIPRSIRLAEAPSHGKPVILYDVRSKGAESYIKLAKEVLANSALQSAPSVRLDPPSTIVPAEGAAGSFTVDMNPAGSHWSAASTESWITVATPGAGQGNGLVSYAVEPNSSFAERVGTIAVSGGAVYTITQAAAATATASTGGIA